ncbi:class I SAM-dependent methyltransferase [Streptomyces iconiensis]|uniref:class I SAM-dependent methyltransferase n=1 Tax=Streptomyces iconiensis TaxID=1384038 RepID=UPI00321BB5FE
MDDRETPAAPAPARRGPETLMFLAEALRDIRTTGAVAPSGRRLAHLLTEPLRGRQDSALRVLEAGAGTGSVTRSLIPLLGPDSHLDIAEANPRFAARLSRLVSAHPGQAADGPAPCGVRVHPERVERLEPGQGYDVIVSGLPFANFAPADVETIMDRYLELLRPGGTLTYFSYLGTAAVRRLLPRARCARHREVEALMDGYRRRCGATSRTVLANLPPARVWSLPSPLRPPGRFLPDPFAEQHAGVAGEYAAARDAAERDAGEQGAGAGRGVVRRGRDAAGRGARRDGAGAGAGAGATGTGAGPGAGAGTVTGSGTGAGAGVSR